MGGVQEEKTGQKKWRAVTGMSSMDLFCCSVHGKPRKNNSERKRKEGGADMYLQLHSYS